MGHATDYITVDKRTDIMKAAQEFAHYNVDRYENPSGSYHGNMTIHDNPICEDYNEAVAFIDSHSGYYSDHAVQYKDKSALKDTKQMITLKERIEKQRKDKVDYANAHSVKTRKSTLAGCEKCGSKIAIQYMHSEYCPVCHNDMRAQYIIDRLKKYDTDIAELEKQYETLKRNQSGKCPIKWLVKVEVHC